MDEEMILEMAQKTLNRMDAWVITSIKFMQFYAAFLTGLMLVFVISIVCIRKFGAAKNAPSFGHAEPLCHLCTLLLLFGVLIHIIVSVLTKSMAGTAFMLIWIPLVLCGTILAVFIRTYCIGDEKG